MKHFLTKNVYPRFNPALNLSVYKKYREQGNKLNITKRKQTNLDLSINSTQKLYSSNNINDMGGKFHIWGKDYSGLKEIKEISQPNMMHDP